MKTRLILFTMIVLGFSCSNREDLGEIISTQRQLEPFEALTVSAVSKVFIVPDTEYSVDIVTHVDLLEDVHTVVSDNKLFLNLVGNHKRIEELTFFIHVPYLNELNVEDVTNIICDNGFTTDSLLIRKHNVGDILLEDIQLDYLKIKVTDVGTIRTSGFSETLVIENDDVSNILASQMVTDYATITHTGVGDIYVQTREDLKIDFTGVGTIYYSGDPKNVEIRNSGVGKVEKQ